jgi:hypothetical protein
MYCHIRFLKYFKTNFIHSLICDLKNLISTLISIYCRLLTPNETTNSYAKFRGISFNSFRFKIVAANKEGYSKDVSEVYVPSKTESKYSCYYLMYVNDHSI